MSTDIFGNNKKRKTPSWKIFIITGLITFTIMLISNMVESYNSTDILISVPIISSVFRFPPHIYQRGGKDTTDPPELPFPSPIIQFIIAIAIIISLISLVIFK